MIYCRMSDIISFHETLLLAEKYTVTTEKCIRMGITVFKSVILVGNRKLGSFMITCGIFMALLTHAMKQNLQPQKYR